MQVVETETLEDGSEYERHTNVITPISLTSSSEYYCGVDDTGEGFYYKIPWTFLKEYLEKGKQYIYIIAYDYTGETYENEIYATYGGLTDADIIQNSMDKQTQAIEKKFDILQEVINTMSEDQKQAALDQLNEEKAHHETSKGIWGTLKEVLSYINPFSENFFVIKLIELLVDALKGLFVPSSDFFNNWVNDMNEYFGNRFGLLYYPVELVVEFLTRLYNLSTSLDSSFVLSFPDLKLMDTVLISGFSFDFNTFLQDETFKNIYNIYLISVDVVLILGLVILCKNTFVDIFGGKFIDDVVHEITDDSDTVSGMSKRAEKEIKYRGIYNARKSNLRRWRS